MTVPYTFGNTPVGASIPLSRLDDNFTALGNSTNVSFTQNAIGSVTRTAQSKMADIISVKDFGAVGDGATNDVPAFNSLIAYINAQGNSSALAYDMLNVYIPEGVYNLKSASLDPILVSNVQINCAKSAVFKVLAGDVWTLGSASVFVDNFWVDNGYVVTDLSDPLTYGCAWVNGLNCARVFIDNMQSYRVPHVFKGSGTGILAAIYIRNAVGLGHPSYNWIDIDSRFCIGAAGIYLINCYGYPYAPPANPALLPKTISGATQTNPVSITCVGHNFSTGDKIRIGGVVGMTQLNGNSYTITVVDANTFTLNGINGAAYGAYVSGGWAVELHWSNPYDTAVLAINGSWDTVKIEGGVYQHWAWLWKLTATGVISFVFDENVIWDYGGSGRFKLDCNGGTFGDIKVDGGWHFCLDGNYADITNSGGGSNFVLDVMITDHIVGLCGGSFINDVASRIINLNITDTQIVALGRARIGSAYAVSTSASANVHLNNLYQVNPVNSYGPSANPYFLPDIGISLPLNTNYDVSNCTMYALTTNYDLVGGNTGLRKRMIRANKRFDGVLPEYVTTSVSTMPATGVVQTNNSGLTWTVCLSGGTMTSVSKNGTAILTSPATASFEVTPGETWACSYTVAPTLVYSYKD